MDNTTINDLESYWLRALPGTVPRGAVQGGHDHYSVPLYVARVRHQGQVIPGKLDLRRGVCAFTWGHSMKVAFTCQVLCELPVRWVSVPRCSLLPRLAVQGGSTSRGTVYIGRVAHRDTLQLGAVYPRENCCSISYAGQELVFNSCEYLTLVQPNEENEVLQFEDFGGDHDCSTSLSNTRSDSPTIIAGTGALSTAAAAAAQNGSASKISVHSSSTKENPVPKLVSSRDLVLTLVGMVFFLIDVVSDINLSLAYFSQGQFTHGALTATFVLLASTLSSLLICIYLSDLNKTSGWKFCISFFTSFMLLALVPPLQLIWYVLQLRRAHLYRRMYKLRLPDQSQTEKFTQGKVQTTYLKAVESLLESLPQMLLQLIIVLQTADNTFQDPNLSLSQAFSIISSLLSLSWTLYLHQWLVVSQRGLLDIRDSTLADKILVLGWRLGEIGSRVLCISACASVYPAATAGVLLVHWTVLSSLHSMASYVGYPLKPADLLGSGVTGIFLIFAFVWGNGEEFQKLRYYVINYSLVGVQHCLMVGLVLNYHSAETRHWYVMLVGIGAPSMFLMALLCMTVYLWCFNPLAQHKVDP